MVITQLAAINMYLTSKTWSGETSNSGARTHTYSGKTETSVQEQP